MELDQEKQNQEAAERCRALAQRIVRELAPPQRTGAGGQRAAGKKLFVK